MLDIVGTIFATALYALIVGTLIALPQMRTATRLALLGAAGVWLALLTAFAALGGLAPGALGPVPAILLPFAAIMLTLFGGWAFLPRARAALISIPLPVLVALNIGRLGGVFFLLLEAQGRMSAPFAPAAGIGDMLTGALALLLLPLAFRPEPHRLWLGLWNALGMLDLVSALTLGLLSAPATPFRLFTEGPGTLAITDLPWIFIPVLLVPIYLLIHLVVAIRLGALRQARPLTPIGVAG